MAGRECRWENYSDSFGFLILFFTRTLGIIGIAASLLLMTVPLWGQSAKSDTSRSVGKEIFAIGREDKSLNEFNASGFKGHPEYTCRVGVDCSTEAFPARHGLALIPEYMDNCVERITIDFTLDQDYTEVVLRLARAGAETTVVTVDGKRTYLVTNTMLGSGDGGVFGAYNLTLGALNKGTHTIKLTVADDGKGNGRHLRYWWDALALFAR